MDDLQKSVAAARDAFGSLKTAVDRVLSQEQLRGHDTGGDIGGGIGLGAGALAGGTAGWMAGGPSEEEKEEEKDTLLRQLLYAAGGAGIGGLGGAMAGGVSGAELGIAMAPGLKPLRPKPSPPKTVGNAVDQGLETAGKGLHSAAQEAAKYIPEGWLPKASAIQQARAALANTLGVLKTAADGGDNLAWLAPYLEQAKNVDPALLGAGLGGAAGLAGSYLMDNPDEEESTQDALLRRLAWGLGGAGVGGLAGTLAPGVMGLMSPGETPPAAEAKPAPTKADLGKYVAEKPPAEPVGLPDKPGSPFPAEEPWWAHRPSKEEWDLQSLRRPEKPVPPRPNGPLVDGPRPFTRPGGAADPAPAPPRPNGPLIDGPMKRYPGRDGIQVA